MPPAELPFSNAPGDAAAPKPSRRRFEFTGQPGEYFRIWIVNLCLTVVTLGVYSAWAKVRTRRYFYQNTRLDGSGFEYTAEPLKILIGRLIVLAFGVLYALAGQFSPQAAVAMIVLLFLASPWMAVRSLAFNHRNSRWRGIRFKFLGSYGEAAKVFLAMPLLVAVTFGLAAPYHHGRQHQFLVANTAYGQSRATFDWEGSGYYIAYLIAFGVVIVGGMIAVVAVAGVVGLAGLETTAEDPESAAGILAVVPMMVGYFAVYGFAAAVIHAMTTNLRYTFSVFPGVRFDSTLSPGGIVWLYLKCGVVVLLTAGLGLPWASIQIARYRAEHLTVLAADGFDHFQQAEEDAHGLGAIADEAAVGFDFDFGL